MDQYLSTIIVTAITGIFSIITLLINKDNHKITDKIDDQHNLVDKEVEVKAKINRKEKEQVKCINDIMLLILDTNMRILKSEQLEGKFDIDDSAFNQADELHRQFNVLSDELEDLDKEYEIVAEMTSEFKNEIERITHEKDSN